MSQPHSAAMETNEGQTNSAQTTPRQNSRSSFTPKTNLNPSEVNGRMRRIIAEDLDWTLAIVPCLSNLCLQSIITNFKENPIFQALTPTQRDFVQKGLSTSLPLELTANLISDGIFWKRCCEERWSLCDISQYGHSWKRMFFERHLENMIELFVPGVTEKRTVLRMIPLCKSYIKRLDISQLLPPIREPEIEEEEFALEIPGKNEDDRLSMDHFDFNILLSKLTNLEELHLVYRVKQCGMNFEWQMFEMTDRDCESLAKALTTCKTLKLLRLHKSHMDDKKCRLLVKHLLNHPSLKELDFSYNQIGDRGARALAKLINQSKLETLNMRVNKIRDHGAKAIAHALSKNSTLLSLNLRLNCVGDEGGEAIGKALLKNNTLLHLHLGGNKLEGPTAIALAKVIAQNNTLTSINLSCNNLGVEGGKALQEAMSSNTAITECDVRMTEIDEQSVSFIDQVAWTNKSSEKKQRDRSSKNT